MACPCWPLVATATWGLADRGRSRSAARITYHAHGLRTGRAMRRERRAADAPCGRFAFLKRSRQARAASGAGPPGIAREAGPAGGWRVGAHRPVAPRLMRKKRYICVATALH